MVNEHVTADVVEAQEFPTLARKHRVSGVPKTVLNDGASEFVGAQPEEVQVEAVVKAGGGTASG